MSEKKPRNLVRENELRRLESKRKREERAVVEYFKVKYPKAYQEASKFTEKLRELHPNKRDLTKTEEFYQLVKNPSKELELKIPLISKDQAIAATVV